MKFQKQAGWRVSGALLFVMALGVQSSGGAELRTVQAKTTSGVVEGVVSADSKVRTYKGIPYAAPPVGELRWKAPQPAPRWEGVRQAREYGPRCMQGRIFDDMIFHDDGPSEDCLNLNLWMPETPKQKPLPVMVWIYGGGFRAGGSSEPRQDGGNLSKKGVLVVSMNYRLGALGFFSHPELSKESGHNASGNYGLLDQVAALRWVQDNIAAFGGDPNNVTIFGESAGSMSVSALMASPLAKGLFHRAIGESGGAFSATRPMRGLAESEAAGVKFAESALGTASIEELRAMPGEKILEAELQDRSARFSPNIDGYFLPKSPSGIFAAGEQSLVPLLAGWNLDEGSYRSIFRDEEPTLENYVALAKSRFGGRAEEFLKVYAATSAAEARRAAQDLAGDQFIGYSTWKWMEMHLATGKSPVYRYRFDQTLPLPASEAGKPGAEPRAYHSAEIEYVFRVLHSKDLPFRPEDHKVSELMASYWTNFARTGDPNGDGLPEWPVYEPGEYPVMHLTADPKVAADQHRWRYEFLDAGGPE